MAMVELPYLNVYAARGRPVAYYRRDGVRVRLRAPGGTALDVSDPTALTAAWQIAHEAHEAAIKRAEAAAEARIITPRSMADLIAQYRASVEFEALKPATKRDYEKALTPLLKDFGKPPVASLRPHMVTQIRDRYAKRAEPDPDNPGQTRMVSNTRQANRIITVLSILMTFARSTLGWISENPALRPKRLASQSDGFTAWTRPQFDQLMASDQVAEPIKRAAALGWFTGQRKQDCLKMTRSARSGGWIEIVPAKTADSSRARRLVPEHPDLAAILDAAPDSDAVTLLTRADGKPWKVDHFNHRFAAAVKAAGLPTGLSFHGIRKGVMIEMVEAGATDAELDAVVPHSDPRIRAHYRQQADQKKLAVTAIGRVGKGAREG